MKEQSIKDIYDLFRFNNLRVVFCPNDGLGLDGPFKEVNESEIVDILNGDYQRPDPKEGDFEEGTELMVSGE